MDGILCCQRWVISENGEQCCNFLEMSGNWEFIDRSIWAINNSRSVCVPPEKVKVKNNKNEPGRACAVATATSFCSIAIARPIISPSILYITKLIFLLN